jgi:hypothetical protein
MAEKVEFYQIYFRDEQKSAIYPFAKPYFNERLTIFFENSVIKDLVLASEAEKIAVCSWKLREKFRYYIGKRRELTVEVLESDYDVLSFTKNTSQHTMLHAADKWHVGFRLTMKRILDEVGIKMPGEVRTPIYQNHFSARREIYQDYVKTYLSPCMEVMSNHPEIKEMVLVDSNYSSLNKAGATPEYLKEKIGVPFYPIAPFLLERLFSIYVFNEKINVTWL